jgi:hypothetical protein
MMKFNTMIGAVGVSLALAMAAWLPVTARAGEQMKGGQVLMMKQIKTPAQAEELKPGDSMVMVCGKCKSVMLHNVSTEKGHIQVMTVGEKHLCPGCDSTIEVVGTGKGKHDEVKHVCSKCGEDSVFCCATKPGAGATKGMEKAKE